MKPPAWIEPVAGLAVPFVILVGLDFAAIRLGSSPVLELLMALAAILALVVTPWVIVRWLYRWLAPGQSTRRWAALVLLTAASSLAWWFVGMTIFVNIHLALGGSL